MARMNGENPLMASSMLEMPLPRPMPNGPTTKAVSGIMISSEKNGTNTIWMAPGMTFFRPFSTKNSSTAANSGGKTWPE